MKICRAYFLYVFAYIARWLLLFHCLFVFFQISGDHHVSLITVLISFPWFSFWLILPGCRDVLHAPPGLYSAQLPAHLHPLGRSHSLEDSWSCCRTWISACRWTPFLRHPQGDPALSPAQSWSVVTGQHWLPECKINGRKEINSRANCTAWWIPPGQLFSSSPWQRARVCIDCIVMTFCVMHCSLFYIYTAWFNKTISKTTL